MNEQLVYGAYGVAALTATGVYVGLPKAGRPIRAGLFLLLTAAAFGGLFYVLARVPGEASNPVSFCALGLLGVGGAIRVVTHPRPVYSALYFILVVLSTAALLILAGAEFLGAALVIVYAGAILVTYVFVIMLSQQPAQSGGRWASILDYDRAAREPFWGAIAGFLLMATLAGMIVRRPWPPWNAASAAALAKENTLALGRVLMTDFAISVELAGVLLMVAMIGAIAIARKRIPRAVDDAPAPAPGEIGKSVPPF
ncbi:MAG: NADH-quinone oxidoreductase subunit J [Phycisphaerae bacterium]